MTFRVQLECSYCGDEVTLTEMTGRSLDGNCSCGHPEWVPVEVSLTAMGDWLQFTACPDCETPAGEACSDEGLVHRGRVEAFVQRVEERDYATTGDAA